MRFSFIYIYGYCDAAFLDSGLWFQSMVSDPIYAAPDQKKRCELFPHPEAE